MNIKLKNYLLLVISDTVFSTMSILVRVYIGMIDKTKKKLSRKNIRV